MDRIRQLTVFQRVVECTSFTRAADSLDLPRSTVSAAITQLERRLGTRLLARNTRHVAPTPDGEAFYARCRKLTADIEDAEQLFRRGHKAIEGTLRVDMPGRIGRLIVAPALPALLDRYPGLRVELGVRDRAVDLIGERVDCAVRVGPLADSGLIARPICELEFINVASPAYLARHGTPHTPQDLAQHWLVAYISPTTGRSEDFEWQDGAATRHVTMRSRTATNNAEACIACCAAGLGILQIPAYDVATALAHGELVEVLPAQRAARLPMTLLYPGRRQLPERFRVFADWLTGLLRERCNTPARVAPPVRRRSRRGGANPRP